MNILIIEDDIILASKLKYIFEKKALSNRIKTIHNYESFLDELYIVKSYDIILVDIFL
jgi:response regulator of citrate/malate metabolism